MAVPPALQRRITPQAHPFTLGLVVVALAMLALGQGWAALFFGLLAAANTAFFRNPRREPPAGASLVVSPADGRVVEVERVEDPHGFVPDAWRIAIFLSIFDVHVNRAPLSGVVRSVRKSGTKFLAAFNGEASSSNVQTRLDLEADAGVRAAVVQITGLIARRIVCYSTLGDRVERGEPYGLICYGSRVEVYLPDPTRIDVRVGQRVSAGTSVLGEVKA